jgi:uncharacterized membrane protein YjjB (DUF3815 family)
MGILLASALGLVVGIELTLPVPFFHEQGTDADRINLVSDVVLAGIVTCGFSVFYNTAWQHVWMAIVGGMAGHGLRYLALDAGCRLEAATFLGGLTVGAIGAWMARSSKTPVAVIAFAGAVTMIPGLSLYRALGGALRLARLPELVDPGIVARTLGNDLQGCIVVSGLVLGLVLGARAVLVFTGKRDAPMGLRPGHELDQAAPRVAAEPADHPEPAMCPTESALHDTAND